MKFSKKVALSASALILSLSTATFAALPAEATSALGGVTTFADDMIAAAWPIVGTIMVAAIGIKLFKKFVSKAT